MSTQQQQPANRFQATADAAGVTLAFLQPVSGVRLTFDDLDRLLIAVSLERTALGDPLPAAVFVGDDQEGE